MSKYFIASTGTGVGKTLITTALCWQLRQAEVDVHAIKPVISGWSEAEYPNDIACILQSLGLPETYENIERVALYRFDDPVSPDLAARRIGQKIDFEKVINFCKTQQDTDWLLVEGIGGVMVPLTPKHTTLDLMAELDMPVVLVAGSYLGAISHTLTAYEALRTRKISVCNIIISESESSAAPLEDIAESIRSFVEAPIILVPRIEQTRETWKYVPPLLQYFS